MEIIAKVNIEESILWKKRVIDFEINKESDITLSWVAQFIWKIVDTKGKREVYTHWIVFDWHKSWKKTNEKILAYCASNDLNYGKYGLKK